ncbi:MAG: hypothetical protein K2M46_00080 [Lachnospiraceae bacterium]|nr:hypothetical protein [Lachnospiraceae bacterium]
MSEFRRFLSYIYSYRDSVKQKNTGFVKVEAREQILRVQVHIKGLYPLGISCCQVYGFYRQEGWMKGILLGEFLIKNGGGDMAVVTERNHISNTEISLEQLGGIYITIKDSPNVVMASAWDNDPVDTQHFSVHEETEHAQILDEGEEIHSYTTEPCLENLNESQKNTLQEELQNILHENDMNTQEEEVQAAQETNQQETVAVYEEPQLEISEKEQEESFKMDDKLEIDENFEEENKELTNKMSEKTIEYKKPEEKEMVETIEKRESSREDVGDNILQEMPEDNLVREQSLLCGEKNLSVDNFTKKASHCGQKIAWHKIMRKYPVVHPFEYRKNLEIVRIEPKDLNLLAKSYWALGNNSFLLHGYCSYRYLLLGRNPENNSFFLGIPGIFHPREKLIANMFGFSEFYMSRNAKLRQGEFGYYIRLVELLEEDCSPRM